MPLKPSSKNCFGDCASSGNGTLRGSCSISECEMQNDSNGNGFGHCLYDPNMKRHSSG